MDWDEDGDYDLLTGEYNGNVTLFENIGTATNPILTKAGKILLNGSPIDVGNLSVPDVTDWDEDGKKDLIMGCDAGYVYVYPNSGTNSAPVFRGSFTIKAGGTTINHIKNCPRILDLNGDGRKDLVLAYIDGICLYWPNQGTNADPVFQEKYQLMDYTGNLDPVPGAYNWSHFGACDWNEDGHADLLYTRWESDIRVHLSGAHLLECTIDPDTPPVVIPPEGGSIDYQIALVNQSAHDAVVDVWTEITLPDGQPYGPVRVVGKAITIQAGGTVNYAFDDEVPASLSPSDGYQFAVYIGKMGNGYFSTDSFPFTKWDYLSADTGTLSEAGGTVSFELLAGADKANRNYFLLGSASGTEPGFPLPGGKTLPLNWDALTGLVFKHANTPIFSDFKGMLDSAGNGAAVFDTLGPLPSGSAGATLHFAFLLYNPFDLVSNAAAIEIVP